jgi:hypothetical protein
VKEKVHKSANGGAAKEAIEFLEISPMLQKQAR